MPILGLYIIHSIAHSLGCTSQRRNLPVELGAGKDLAWEVAMPWCPSFNTEMISLSSTLVVASTELSAVVSLMF
jgi:hypothetical protein